MANITAADVNKLRTITGAGMMDCKKALVESDGDFDLAITLFPTSIEEIKQIADENLIMPPKSTWIEPKIRTGLIIYETE